LRGGADAGARSGLIDPLGGGATPAGVEHLDDQDQDHGPNGGLARIGGDFLRPLAPRIARRQRGGCERDAYGGENLCFNR
ncbi:MAG: hypothetical protein ACJAVS_002319, partial [Paracoccaceae bacterium]